MDCSKLWILFKFILINNTLHWVHYRDWKKQESPLNKDSALILSLIGLYLHILEEIKLNAN